MSEENRQRIFFRYIFYTLNQSFKSDGKHRTNITNSDENMIRIIEEVEFIYYNVKDRERIVHEYKSFIDTSSMTDDRRKLYYRLQRYCNKTCYFDKFHSTSAFYLSDIIPFKNSYYCVNYSIAEGQNCLTQILLFYCQGKAKYPDQLDF